MVTETLRPYTTWLDENIESYLLIVTYFYISFIIIMGVFNRFVLQSSSGWEIETARLLFIWLTWIGASIAVRKRSHIRIDFIYRQVSDRTEGLLYIFSDLVIIAFCLVGVYAFYPVLSTTMDFGATLVTIDLSVVFFQAAIPIGLALMMGRAIQMLILDARAVRNGERVYQGETLFESAGGAD